MKNLTIVFALLILFTTQTQARDTKHLYSIEKAMQTSKFQQKLDPNISFYFGNQKHPKILKKLGEYSTNKKTNAFKKSDLEACEWVFLSALLSLQQRAKTEGGNAIINISSYYKKRVYTSNTEYECHAGGIVAGVALTGEVVTLAK